VALNCDALVHVTVIEYTRPAPNPFRSARRLTLSGPVNVESETSNGSLLVTPVIAQPGAGSLSSATVTPIVTGTIFPFGGQRTFGVAVSAERVGGATAGRLGHGDGPGPPYVMHQFLAKVLRPPLLEASSLMSNPIGPYSLETRLGGFPAAMF
jgi:hypothetical protein